jgi:BASS family bile acid:Na+ symporter
MFRLNDLILLLVVFSSMLAGILFPGFGSYFQPFPKYLLMILFFLSFLPIEIHEIRSVLKNSPLTIALFTVFKLLLLPLGVYFLFRTIAPAYAASALLLSAISTGVTAPFISNLVRGNSALVMVMVVVTSPLIPFTLPALVELLFSRSVKISFIDMFGMLSFVIFVPMVLVEVLRRTAPGFISAITRINYPLSLVLFALINLGVFSRYADFFYQEPAVIFEAAAVATVLGGIYGLSGALFFFKRPMEDRLAGAISVGNMNNVLVIVFASQFFGPLEPTVASLYLLPYFGLIIPMRFYEHRERRKAGLSDE